MVSINSLQALPYAVTDRFGLSLLTILSPPEKESIDSPRKPHQAAHSKQNAG